MRRNDKGLLSPFALRSGGILLALIPLVLLALADWSQVQPVWAIFELGFFFSLSAICFRLASRRQNPVLGSSDPHVDA